MNVITEEAKSKLVEAKEEFIHMLGSLRGESIYNAGFTIATYAKVFDLIFNNELDCNYLSDLIMCNENSIVNSITAEYVLTNATDFNELRNFVKSKVDSLYPR